MAKVVRIHEDQAPYQASVRRRRSLRQAKGRIAAEYLRWMAPASHLLTPRAMVLYGWLKLVEDSTKAWTREQIARELRLSVRQVDRHIEELERARCLEVRRLGLGKGNRYRTLVPAWAYTLDGE